jgi:hypothetical protein
MAAVILLAVASAVPAAFEPELPGTEEAVPQRVRLTVDLALAGGMLGIQELPWARCRFMPGMIPYSVARAPRVGIGVEARRGPGLTVGTTLAEYDLLLHERSLLPVNVRASWDFSSETRWTHRSFYAFAALHHHTLYYGPALPIAPPLLQADLGAGVAHTNVVVTSWVEFRVRMTDWPSLGPCVCMAIGLDLGGTYSIVRSRPEGWE